MATVTTEHRTRDGRRILVIDHALDEAMAEDLYSYFRRYALWGFDEEDDDGDHVPFICTLDNELIRRSPLWTRLEKLIRHGFGPGFVPYNCSVNHTRYGDNPTERRDTYDPESRDITLLVYLNSYWNKNFGGETVYFDEQGEIELSVLPRFCRVAMHEGYINHASRAPGRLFPHSRFTLAIKASPDEGYRRAREHEADDQQGQDQAMIEKQTLETHLFGHAL